MEYDFDYIIIGSGFGGSVSAHRLTQKGYKVAVIEMGRRFTPQNMPKSTWSLTDWLWQPSLGLRGFFGMSFFKHLVVLHGNAVGGGSVTYANTLLVPPAKIWNQGSWAGLTDWQSVMPAHYSEAKRMLGVTTNKILGPADHRLKEMAKVVGVEHTFYPTEVGVFFGDESAKQGTVYPDPYFGGEGPERTSCLGCGACMIGCIHGAKNSLDKNYLFFAEKNGARVFAETKVVDVKPQSAGANGQAGYEVSCETTGRKKEKLKLTAGGVVFSASSLGTQELLFKLKDRGSLPNISSTLGNQVRTNAESLIGVKFPGSKTDLSTGIAIGSGIYLNDHTHIEATRYPNGSDFLGLFSTVMTLGKPGITRPFYWLATLIKLLLTRPIMTLRSLSPFGFARNGMIFLCMQTLDGHLNMRYRRPWYNPFMKKLVTEGDRVATFIPEANDFAIKAAAATGGIPMTTTTEIFMNIPMTAHCIGGAVMAEDESKGVCDYRNRVFGYQNMFICDGSVLGANLGVNPSLTITAVTEHAMSHIPPKS
ncbi:MAG TPA: GMC family oxidoreductase [Bacteriovoracaceae bacterium]|nr:GMC family oxidoreductase [Bacteriovoracaceae bacterium]